MVPSQQSQNLLLAIPLNSTTSSNSMLLTSPSASAIGKREPEVQAWGRQNTQV